MRERQPADLILFTAVVVLLALGVAMVFSASSVKALVEYGDSLHFLKRQLLWAALGLGIMFFTVEVDYRAYRRLSWPTFLLSLVLLLLVALTGPRIRGTKGWLELGFFNIQPVEVAKLALTSFLASYLDRKQRAIRTFWSGVAVPMMWVGLVVALVMLQPDFGSAMVIVGMAFLQLFAVGARLEHLSLVALAGLPAVAALAILEPYRLRRLAAFLNPWADPRGSGYQTIQSLLALGSGGLSGLGLGQSRQKFAYLPENHTDFIFAILGEELGLLGTTLVLLLFFIFLWRGLRIALLAPDFFGSALAVGITVMIVFQALMNIAIISGALPITGITLPFISYGGSSLAISLAGIGILLNISKQAT